ncbi:hypothetical protein Glove_123g73 [Diversispora epigaea]|uniref:Uncharacterized protein n=1 Tax=Diversispora epigaea TaxID=1348612 RepID=A0A397J8K4_9GLOM|nr:hypothetical protein Glove_123g73 [Diversispora epigaea]
MQSARQTRDKTNSSHNLTWLLPYNGNQSGTMGRPPITLHNLTRLLPYNGNRSKALSPHTNITIKSGFLKELEYAVEGSPTAHHNLNREVPKSDDTNWKQHNYVVSTGAIKTDKEAPLGSDQIENNTNKLKNKLRKESTPLYQHLYSGVNEISVQELAWKDPLANQIIRDNSNLVQGLPGNLKKVFMFTIHTNDWKESEDKLEEITLKILETLESVWRNPTFCSEFIATMNEEYSKCYRKGDGRVGRRPDIMFISKEDNKYYELMYAECSRIICTKQKEEDDDIKLWRECNDGLYWAQKSRRLKKEQFGIIGIQVAGCRLSLNVLIRDELEVHRYYKLHETEIPIRYSNDPSILADFIYTLLLFRNILIVNMSLLRCAHDRRSNRNLDNSTVTSPPPNS